jgi:aldose 1-epimerase
VLTLRNNGAVLDLLPQIGGAVSRFTVDGIDVLRPTPAGATSVLDTACFPLVPFANRIAHGAFTFNGESVHLPRNFGDHPHALHGQGWQNAWRIQAQSSHAATLVFAHSAGSWPWDYTAAETFELSPAALGITLGIVNRSARAMPVSLGLHPYFLRAPGARLFADVAGVWLNDETGIPTAPSGPAHFLDLAHGAVLADAPFVDHCHFGWRHIARIARPGREITLTAGPQLGHLHVFAPRGENFFCVEPVSAMPDAFNRAASGMRVLDPGESFTVSMTLACAHVKASLPISHPD